MDDESLFFERVVELHLARKRAAAIRDYVVTHISDQRGQIAARMAVSEIVAFVEREVMASHQERPELMPSPPFEGEAQEFLGMPATLRVFEEVQRRLSAEESQDTEGLGFYSRSLIVVEQVVRLKTELGNSAADMEKWLTLLIQEVTRIPKPLLKKLR